jgi:hypothetical protein
MASETQQQGHRSEGPAPRTRTWPLHTIAALALAAALLAAMTTLAIASTTTGPLQALPAAARAHLGRPATPAVGAGHPAALSPHAVEIPRTPVGTELAWLLREINGGSATITEDELEDHFGSRFLRAVPARAMILVLRRASDLEGSAVVTRINAHRSSLAATARVAAPGQKRYVVRVTLESRAHHRITSLTIDSASGS